MTVEPKLAQLVRAAIVKMATVCHLKKSQGLTPAATIATATANNPTPNPRTMATNIANFSSRASIKPPVKFFAILNVLEPARLPTILRRLVLTNEPTEIDSGEFAGAQLNQHVIGALWIMVLELSQQFFFGFVEAHGFHGRAIALQNLAMASVIVAMAKKNAYKPAHIIRSMIASILNR